MKNKYDLLKAVAILLVVLGHVTNHYMDALLTKAITITVYLFHVSLFVAISGAVFQMGCERGKYTKFIPFMVNKVKRLFVPFCFVALLVLAPTLVYCGNTNMSYLGTIVDIFIGGGSIRHLWYLQALLCIFIVMWFIKRIGINLYVALAVSFAIALGVWLSGVEANRYLSIGMAIGYLPMFLLGMILVGVNCSRKGIVAWILGCLMFGGIQIFSHSPSIDSVVHPLFSASIVGLIISLSDYAYKWLKDSPTLVFFAKNSFGIYLFHMTPIYFIRYWGCDAWPLWVSVPATFVFSLATSLALTMLVRVCRLGVLIVIGEK